jgi:hypothetical protein
VENFQAFEENIPQAFWAELKNERFIREEAPVPG